MRAIQLFQTKNAGRMRPESALVEMTFCAFSFGQKMSIEDDYPLYVRNLVQDEGVDLLLNCFFVIR